MKLRNDSVVDGEVVLVEELGVLQGDFRVDLAAVNGHIHGYEIKSDVDSLSRLQSQVAAYSSLCEFLTIVVGKRHLGKVRASVPKFCGLVLARQKGTAVQLRDVRKPKKNSKIRSDALVQLLWKDEALTALEQLGAAKGLKGKPRREIWDRLVALLSVSELQSLVTKTLKNRPNWRADSPRV